MGFADLLTVGDRSVRQLLGGSITYTPGVGAAVVVDGIFDAAYVKVELGEPGVSSQGPAAWLTLTDLPSDPEVDEDATVTVAGVTYKPHTVQPDGQGTVLLLLHRVT